MKPILLLTVTSFASCLLKTIRSHCYDVEMKKVLLASTAIMVSISSLTASAESFPAATKNVLTLENTVKISRQNDPWLTGNRFSQEAVESASIAAGTLPDPKVSISVINLAADTFEFNQEQMTQFKVGVSQMLPRGDTLALKQQQLSLLGEQFPFQRQDREAKITVTTAKLWLEAYKAQESIALIESDRALFEQLADVAQASYSSAVGKTRQQDIVRAQLELTRLDDRLTMLNQKLEMSQQRLSQWLSQYRGGDYSNASANNYLVLSDYTLSKKLPKISMLESSLFNSTKSISPQILFQCFAAHPAVKSLEKKIAASKSGIEIAKQGYKPEWGLNASYGYRDASQTGVERADFLSVGVSFDIPLFTADKQDKNVQSAIAKNSAVKTEKWLLIRRLVASFETARAQLVRLNERQKLYQDRLLPQMHDQAEASLTAYTNDDGDFAEVVRSRIAELNAQIDALQINVERQKNIVELNYLFMKRAEQIISIQPHVAINDSRVKYNRSGANQ